MAVADSMEGWPTVEPPTEAEIARVRQNAVSLGGAALQNPHSNRSANFNVKGMLNIPKRVELTNCDEVAEFTAPLEWREDWEEEVSAGKNPDGDRRPTSLQSLANGTKMCAVDDAAHLWPRFNR